MDSIRYFMTIIVAGGHYDRFIDCINKHYREKGIDINIFMGCLDIHAFLKENQTVVLWSGKGISLEPLRKERLLEETIECNEYFKDISINFMSEDDFKWHADYLNN